MWLFQKNLVKMGCCSLKEKLKYRVKVINPKAKKESITIDWHGVNNKFENVSELKKKLAESLSTHVVR